MTILVTGGTSGIGAAIVKVLTLNGIDTVTLADDPKADIELDLSMPQDDLTTFGMPDGCTSFEKIIHCAGVNLLRKHEDITDSDMVYLFRVNALSTFFLNRLFMPQISCSIVSDAAWTPMTHSLAYNVSKAAQHMLIRQMAHEDRDCITFGVAPGKVADTGMSKYIDETFPPMRGMTFKEGRAYQLKGLRTGELDPEVLAKFVIKLVLGASPHYHGHIFPIGG